MNYKLVKYLRENGITVAGRKVSKRDEAKAVMLTASFIKRQTVKADDTVKVRFLAESEGASDSEYDNMEHTWDMCVELVDYVTEGTKGEIDIEMDERDGSYCSTVPVELSIEDLEIIKKNASQKSEKWSITISEDEEGYLVHGEDLDPPIDWDDEDEEDEDYDDEDDENDVPLYVSVYGNKAEEDYKKILKILGAKFDGSLRGYLIPYGREVSTSVENEAEVLEAIKQSQVMSKIDKLGYYRIKRSSKRIDFLHKESKVKEEIHPEWKV